MGSGVRLKARWRLARAAVKSFLWLIAGVLLVGVVLLRTGLGHRTVLEYALDQARARVAGDIEVAGIRSANLIRGVRLIGLHLRTPDGETLLTVDSLEASYDVLALVRGDLVFDDVRLWGPDLSLVREPGAESGTLRDWIGPTVVGGGGGVTPTLIVRGAALSDGRLEWSLPVSPADTAGPLRWEPTEQGPVRRVDLNAIDMGLEDLVIGDPAAAVSVQIRGLSAVARVLAEPLTLTGVDADVVLRSDTLALEIEGGDIESTPVRGRASLVLGDTAGVTTLIDVALTDLELARFAWLTPRLPELVGNVQVTGRMSPEGQRWTISDLDARLAGGTVRGSGTVDLNGSPRLSDVDLVLGGVPIDVLDLYLDEPLGIDGRASGRVVLAGPPGALDASGRLVLEADAYAPLTADFAGIVRLDGADGLAVQDFRATLDPMDWSLLADRMEGFPLEGPGRAVVHATGSLRSGLRFDADLTHAPDDAPPSHVLATGSLRDLGDGTVSLDVQAELAPLSLVALRRAYPDLPLTGEIAGAVRGRGILRDMAVTAEVTTELGRLDVDGRINLRDPAQGYRLEGQVTDFRASDLIAGLPDPSSFTGRVDIEGDGFDAATMTATVDLDLGASSIGDLDVDTLRVAANVRAGVLTLDTLRGRVGGFELDAGGTLAVDSARPAGEIRVRFATESLEGLRPLFMSDSLIARDELDPIERDLLLLEGIDPEGLPTQDEITMSGRAEGDVVLTGSLSDFTAEGDVRLDEVRYGLSSLSDAAMTFRAEGLPGLAGTLRAEVETGAAEVLDRSFASGRLELDYTRPEGTAVVELLRDESEDYRARTTFQLDSLGGTLELEELALRFDTLTYQLAAPAQLAWSDSAFVVDGFELVRPGPEPLSIRARGVIPRRGAADFTLEARSVQLERLVQLAQIEDLDLEGIVDLDLRLGGTAGDPTLQGAFAMRDVVLETVDLTRLEGDLDYASRTADVRMEAWRDDVPVLRVEGDVPIDLSLVGVEDRIPDDRDMDLTAEADSLPAAFVLALLEDLEDVEGTISGEVALRGSVETPVAEGTIRLRDGAWTVGAIGVRQTGVEATLEVGADDRVRVTATGRAGGSVSVEGTVTLATLTDPELDLAIRMSEFAAVDRRDVEGTVSGEVQLTGSFRQPVVTGDLQVDEGVIHLEEFQRAAGVVDLSDPRFFAYVDTALFSGRPLLAETRNPFMDNLRVNVAMAVERNTWLRSAELNVEMGGELIVVYDRPAQDLVLIGQLQAVRGQYTFLGRTFEVRSGTVEFIGTPGINPNLDIQAVASIRGRENPFDITANLSGTLVDPRVALSTEEGALPESDLVSYLIFGRPSTEVNALFAGSDGGDALFGQGISVVSSSLATSLGAIAQGWGFVDYLSITQAGSGFSDLAAGTQIEAGQYFARDFFAAITIRPWSGTAAAGGLLGGFRLEWQANTEYHVELFAEDRFLRGGGFGFQELGLRSMVIYGLQLVREWGY